MQRLSARERRWGDWARYARTTRCAGARPNAHCRARGASALRPSSDSMSSRRRWTRCVGRWNVSTSHTGELHRPEHVQALIEQVAGRIESLGVGECAKLAKYLRNRAPGLVLAQKSVLPRLGRALVGAGGELGVPVLVLGQGAAQAPCPRAAPRAVSTSSWRLRGTARPAWPRERIAARCIEEVLHQRHRASSAIEGFNAALRPYLYVHKGATAFSTCSAPGSICARGAGDGTRGPVLTSA